MPKTARSLKVLTDLPLGTRIIVRGKNRAFPYARTENGWTPRSSFLAPVEISNQEMADTIARLSSKAAEVMSA